MDIIVLSQFLSIYNYPPFPIILLNVILFMPGHGKDEVVARVSHYRIGAPVELI